MEMFKQCHQMIAERKATCSRRTRSQREKADQINMEESDIALLDIQAKEKGVPCRLGRGRLFASSAGRGYTPQDLAALVSRVNRISISLVVRWSGSSTSFVELCLGLGRQPSLVTRD